MNQQHEMSLMKQGREILYVIGCDEAGRGPLAGPVATAASCFALQWASDGQLPASVTDLLNDSKAMTETDRITLAGRLLQSEEAYATYSAFSKREDKEPFTFTRKHADGEQLALLGGATLFMPAATIDERNILEASLDGMCICAAAVVTEVNNTVLRPNGLPEMTRLNTVVLIDGPHTPWGLMSSTQQHQKIASQLKALKAKLRKAARDAATKSPASTAKKATKCSEPDDAALRQQLPQHERGRIEAVSGWYCVPVVKGDALCPSIAAASVLAKVARDDFLAHTMHPKYPQYEFSSHKGYPTKQHMSLLKTHGACEFHRHSFGPVRAALGLPESDGSAKPNESPSFHNPPS